MLSTKRVLLPIYRNTGVQTCIVVYWQNYFIELFCARLGSAFFLKHKIILFSSR